MNLRRSLPTSKDQTNEYADRTFDIDVYSKGYFEGAEGSAYESYHKTAGILRRLVEIIANVLESRLSLSDSRTLDLGGAYGHVSSSFLARGALEAWNMELSEWAASQCKVLYPTVTTITGNVLEDSTWRQIPDNFDLVTAFEFFEHIPTNDLDLILMNLKERCKWGVFLLQSRDWVDLDKDLVRGDHGHLHFHDHLWWLNVLEEYGDLDFPTMLDLNFATKEVEGVLWANRLYVIRFNKL